MTIKGNVTNAGIQSRITGPIFHVSLGNVTIQDLTLQNARNTRGGGAFRQTGGNTTLDNVTIKLSDAPDGGGAAVYRGTLTLRNGTNITTNTADRGGGVFVGKNGRLEIAEITSSNAASTVVSNTARQVGGGIFAQGRVTILRQFRRHQRSQPRG